MKYTNHGGIALPLAVWLAADYGYDQPYEPNVISATTLLKPTRSVVLGRRLEAKGQVGTKDLADVIASRLGTAVHTAAEVAWSKNWDDAMRSLGYPDALVSRIKVNPDPDEIDDETLPVYIEKRTKKELDGITISGKFDFVVDGRVIDIKTTKCYSWIKGTNDEKYVQQASIYRWLNPDIITGDTMDIEFLFTDWNYIREKAEKNYPPRQAVTKTYPLMGLEETEQFIRAQITRIKDAMDLPQEQLPRCTPAELWMDPPKWAYYKNPKNTKRATKLFESSAEASQRKHDDGGVGLIIERVAEPKFCRYCDARPACTQAEEYINSGILTL